MSDTHVITKAAHGDLADIVRFIGRGDLAHARRYYGEATDAFFAVHDGVMYRRASPGLPDFVREMPVKGFTGYSLRVMKHTDGRYYLVSAHRPGRSDENKNRHTRTGLRDLLR